MTSGSRWAHLRSPLATQYTATGLWRGLLVDSHLDHAAARSKVVVIPETFRSFGYPAMIAELRPELPDLSHVITVRGTGADLVWDDLLAADPDPDGGPEPGRHPCCDGLIEELS